MKTTNKAFGTSLRSALSTSLKVAALAVAGLALTVGPAEAQHRGGGGFHGGGGYHGGGYRGGYHGGGWGPGWVLGGIGLGLGVAAASSYYYNAPYYGYGYGAPVYYSAPPVTVVDPAYADPGVNPGAPGGYPSANSAPAQSNSAPAPIFYPRNGQSASQTERDRQDCNHWATTQQSAMNDANVFQRATLACMDGRGYTVR
jgi:hypothetical protein